jgi:hypothetical protein
VRRALCMIDPTVEEVGLRRMPVAVAVASLTAVARAARGHDGGTRQRRCGGGGLNGLAVPGGRPMSGEQAVGSEAPGG